jgi:Gpi18-like mannosyltransferase
MLATFPLLREYLILRIRCRSSQGPIAGTGEPDLALDSSATHDIRRRTGLVHIEPHFPGQVQPARGLFEVLVPPKARTAAALTLLGGLSLGFFAWYVLVARAHVSAAASEAVFIAVIFGFTAATFGVWHAYARIIGRWCGIDRDTLLRVDGYSYLPLVLLWLYLLQVPAAFSSASALAVIVLLLVIAVKAAELAWFVRSARAVLAVFVATRLPLMIIAPLAAIIIGQRQGHHWSTAHGIVLDVWGRWDAQHYIQIAVGGYHGADIAFFPLYPFLLHVVGNWLGDHLLAGLLISNLAFLVALAYLYALVKLEYGDENIAYHAAFYIAIFPTAIFFSAVYTESLFLALTVASVYYARHGNFITSGVFGALAALTRVEGVLLVVPLAYEVWQAWQQRRGTALFRGIIGLGLVPMGLLTYMGYLYALVGDPMYFSKVQVNWNRHLAGPWMSFYNTFKELAKHPLASSTTVNHLIELVFTIIFIALLVVAFRRLRPSYAWYFAASLLVPMSTSSLMSMPRFVLVVFPAFMLLALWGQRPVVNSAIVSLSLPMLGLFTVLYADWYWLA